MDIRTCTDALRAKVGASSGLDATLKFDCGDDGLIYIDGKSVPNSVSNENKEADCTIGISLKNLAALLAGQLEPTTAFMMGKLKVSGDMSIALKLKRVV